MERLVKGDVVVPPFPFADLSETKRRPAMVVAHADDIAIVICQIASQIVNAPDAVRLDTSDFESGSLKKLSNIRPNRLFTAIERASRLSMSFASFSDQRPSQPGLLSSTNRICLVRAIKILTA